MPSAVVASQRHEDMSASTAAGLGGVHEGDAHEGYVPCVSTIMQQVTTRLAAIAATDLPVLICGEPGSGKSSLAHQLHRDSARRGTPLMVLECGTATSGVVECLPQASGQTVLLEGLEALRPSEQNSLVRVLDTPNLTARLLVTTSDDPADLVARKRLRADLLYRLDVIRLDVPPLRQRPADVVFLATHFLDLAGRRWRRVCTLTAGALARLREHSWPGNVRELRTCIFAAVALGTHQSVLADDLCLRTDSDPEADLMGALSRLHAEAGPPLFGRAQRVIVQWALATCGNQRRAAALLGISRGSLRTWLRRHELDHLEPSVTGEPRASRKRLPDGAARNAQPDVSTSKPKSATI